MNTQALHLTGTVTDQTGNPLPFANVYYSTPAGAPATGNIGTTTNARGRYDLGNFVGSLHVTASYVGYQRQTRLIPMVGGSQTMNFSMKPETATLPEFNVTAKLPRQWPQKVIISALIAASIYGIYRLMIPR
jgi:hypothetical protein